MLAVGAGLLVLIPISVPLRSELGLMPVGDLALVVDPSEAYSSDPLTGLLVGLAIWAILAVPGGFMVYFGFRDEHVGALVAGLALAATLAHTFFQTVGVLGGGFVAGLPAGLVIGIGWEWLDRIEDSGWLAPAVTAVWGLALILSLQAGTALSSVLMAIPVGVLVGWGVARSLRPVERLA